LLLLAGCQSEAATIRISQEPLVSTASDADITLIDTSNGDGTYTTHKVGLATLRAELSGSNTVSYVTNLYVTIEVVTNLTVITNYVNQSYITNLQVTTSYLTNVYVTMQVTTNLAVTQQFTGNKVTVTNVFFISNTGGSLVNSNLDYNSLVMTDGSDKETSLTNGQTWQILSTSGSDGSPPFWNFLTGEQLYYGNVGNPVGSGGTNYIIDFALPPYSTLVCTNNVNLIYATNSGLGYNQSWGGVHSMKLWPAGADRVLTMPTNWIFLRTNWLTLSGSFWTVTLTNATQGNGPRIGWLSLECSGPSQTNVVALFQESP